MTTKESSDIRRKLNVIHYARKTGNVNKACRWKIRSLRAPHSGSEVQTIPEMIGHHKPECKQHNISAKI